MNKGAEDFFTHDGVLEKRNGTLAAISRMSEDTAMRASRPPLDMRSFAIQFASYFYSKSRSRIQV